MRVCYLIQVHRGPRQVARLVARIGDLSPGALVVVARDDSGCALAAPELPSAAEVRCLDVLGPVLRGYLSMLSPWLGAVDWLRSRGVDYDWLVYLSGQDYPVRPLGESEAALAAADCDGFLRYWPALAPGGPWRRRKQGSSRYLFRYYDLPAWAAPLLRLARRLNGVQRLVHAHLVYGPRLGFRAIRTPFGPDRVCFAGRQWTTLRRACAEYVLDTVRRESGLIDYYRRTICPDESLVQTVLVNSGRFRLVDDNLRYADTDGGRDGHARVLGVEDFDHLVSGRYHFARKFDLDRDPLVLDLLDQHLGRHVA